MLTKPLPAEPTVPAYPPTRAGGIRFHRTYQPRFTRDQKHVLRTTVQEPGTIRRLWHNLIGYVGTGGPFSWTANAPTGPAAVNGPVSTPLRYLITTVDTLTAGNQRSNPMRRPVVKPRVAHTAPTLVSAGNVGYRPTVRSRVPSFGSRVPSLNGGGSFAGADENG